MSTLEKEDLIGIDKYIDSKLWYTALTVSKQTSVNNYPFTEKIADYLNELINLIQVDSSIRSEITEEYQWILHILHRKFNANNPRNLLKQKIYEHFKKLQFLYSLKAINSNAFEDSVREELLALLVSKVETNEISESCLNFLRDGFKVNPAVTCKIINTLCYLGIKTWADKEKFNCIQNLLRDVLEELIGSEVVKEDACMTYEQHPVASVNRIDNNNLRIILCILSTMSTYEDVENIFIKWLSPILVKMSNLQDVEVALYSRQSNTFFREYHKLTVKNLQLHVNDNEKEENLTNTNSLCDISSRNILLYMVFGRLHWFLQILDVCQTYISNSKYDKALSIMSHNLLKDTWVVLLMKFFLEYPQKQFSSVESWWEENNRVHSSLLFLLDKCNLEDEDRNSVLYKMYTTFKSHLRVLKWILNNRNPGHVTGRKTEEGNTAVLQQAISTKYILVLLQNFGTLSVLKKTTNIHTAKYDEIKDVLEETFTSSPSNSTYILEAYFAMLNALKAILSLDCSNSDPMKNQNIEEYLTNMVLYLKNTHPLTLRLEAMENIFSLLFLRYEDFDNASEDVECLSSSQDRLKNESKMKKHDREMGFVPNEYAIKRIIHHLENSILAANADYSKQKQESVNPVEELDDIKTRLSALSRSLADTKWRLDLLEDLNISGTAAVADPPVLETDLFNRNGTTASSERHLLPSDEIDGVHTNRCSGRHRKHSRSVGVTVGTGMTVGSSDQRDSVTVNYMLTPKESFVIRYLWNNDYVKAEQLMEILDGKKGTKLAAEVQFSKALQNFRLSVAKDESAGLSETVKPSEKKSTSSPLVETIRIAAQEGVQTSRHANRLETFLASQSGYFRRSTSDTNDETATQDNETLTLCVLDLALTAGQTHRLSANICDVAQQYLKASGAFKGDKTSSTTTSTSLEDVAANDHARFFARICALLRENKNEAAVTDILCDVRVPLSSSDARKQSGFFATLAHELRECRTLNRQAHDDSDYKDRPAQYNNRSLAFASLRKIIGACSDGNEKYLQNVHAHLQLLYTLIPTPLGESTHTIITPTNVSDSLLISLHSYFAHQIFDLRIEPDQLEDVASKLRINIVYVIFVSVYPKLYCRNDVRLMECSASKSKSRQQRAVLNDIDNYVNVSKTVCLVQNPNECIAEILTELLNVLRALQNVANVDDDGDQRDEPKPLDVISYSQVKEITGRSDLRHVLSKTIRLASLDLGELSMGNETLTFFLNVWNAMFLHAFLVSWSNKPPLGGLRRDISLSSIGYTIGDLGFVTLVALRSKLLGNSLASAVYLDRKSFANLEQRLDEELNEPAWQDLDLVQDPRVIFAMANEFHGTPVIRVYNASKLNEQLNDAERDYLNYYSSIVEEDNNEKQGSREKRNVIVFPDIVRRIHEHEEHPFSVNIYKNTVDENATVRYAAQNYAYEIVLKYKDTVTRDTRNEFAVNRTLSLSYENQKINSSLLRYLEGQCWLLSYFAQQHQNVCNSSQTIDEKNDSISLCSQGTNRTVCLDNLLNSSWVEELCPFVDSNKILLAICENHVPKRKLWDFLEEELRASNWQKCLDTISALSHDFTDRNVELLCLRDVLLRHWIREATRSRAFPAGDEILRRVYRIKNIYVLAQTILENVRSLPMEICEHALLHATCHVDNEKLPMHCRQRIEDASRKATIFRRMRAHLDGTDLHDARNDASWYEVAYSGGDVDDNTSRTIVESLINAGKCELCLEWLECQTFPLKVQSLINEEFLIGLLRRDTQGFVHALKLLGGLPPSKSVQMCKNVLKKLESIDSLEFTVTYLIEHCKTTTEVIKYKKTFIGVRLLRNLGKKERSHYLHLIKEPLLMLEQLLMNCKFENIQKILQAMQSEAYAADESSGEIWTSIRLAFDETIRFYAKKSLDFRVSTLQRADASSEAKQKAKTVVTENDNGEFVMPINVPTREEWVPNDKARECSCCKVVIFSMFNRRHHCRRCGRVVCAVCSQHRAIVAGYPGTVLVRVCNDCKKQTQLRNAATSTAATSEVDAECWKLTRNENHDRMIREDFSYEYAPNITLCLAILNLHSDHKAYTNFLLDRCDEMKRLLQPVDCGKINPEIDHAVIIKMMRSLLITAKVKCAKLGFNSGLVHCDRFLSQVDLITTLVRSDLGLTLVPSTDDLDDHAFRKLRDLFIDKEQWTLALDISTKAGLETQGVWAAWGKACLKVGYFERAREKFSHCLGKITEEYVDDWVILSHSQDKENVTVSTGAVKKNEILKNRPLKDPSLLVEILQILENLHMNEYRVVQQTAGTLAYQNIPFRNEMPAPSTNLMPSPSFNSRAHNTPNYYQESLYYLLTYGSSNSILDFFLKHDEYDKCLSYVLENDLDADIFYNAVYWCCMKNGNVDKLHESMKAKDSSLLSWSKYLVHICRNLEKKEYLHSLYQLQLFMKDYVRATMTCIRFYTSDANTYNDLCSRKHLLLSAQKHLEAELAQAHDGNLGNKFNSNSKRRKSTGTHFDGGSHHSPNLSSTTNTAGRFIIGMDATEVDKHINTIYRQMEIAKFLANGENEGRNSLEILHKLVSMDYELGLNSSQVSTQSNIELPTLFGDQRQKTYLAVLAILCGRNVEEGFGIAFRIMQDYNLRSQKVYSLAGHMLALRNNISAIEQLVKCCRSSGAPSMIVTSDYVLTHCVKLLLERSHTDLAKPIAPKDHIDPLIRLIMDVELKISAYIESRQLKAAYLLAVKHSRAQDIKRILREADRLGQNAIKNICTKWLQQQLPKS